MPPDVDLRRIVEGPYEEGRKRYGDLRLDLTTYAMRIDFIVRKHLGPAPSADAVLSFVKSLHLSDLYLATACAQCGPGAHIWNQKGGSQEDASIAWRMLDNTYRSFIRDLVRFFYRQNFTAHDLAESVMADLFLPDRSGSSRIASYEGRSSLSTWLRVIVWNRAINTQRSSAFAKSTEMEADIPDEPALHDLETAVRVQRYEAALQDALFSACLELSHQERLMLLWRYENELQLGQIAKLLGMHQSTVTRQLEKMQSKLRQRVTAILLHKHGLSPLSVQECFKEMADNLGHRISILDFIRKSPPPAGNPPPPPRSRDANA